PPDGSSPLTILSRLPRISRTNNSSSLVEWSTAWMRRRLLLASNVQFYVLRLCRLVISCFALGCLSHAQGIMTTAAGGGWTFRGDGGPASAAQLATVEGMALDAAGNLYAADSENHVVIKVSPGRALTVV